MKLIQKFKNPSGTFQYAQNNDGAIAYPNENTRIAQEQLKEMLPSYLWDKLSTWVSINKPRFFKSVKNNTVSENDVINRLYSLFLDAQKPKVANSDQDSFTNKLLNVKNAILHPNVDKNSKTGITVNYDSRRANYNPMSNTMYHINTFNDYITEFSHAIDWKSQYKTSGNITANPKSFLGDLKDENGLSGYDRPGHHEYMTHQITQPAINSYLLDPKSTGFGAWQFTLASTKQKDNSDVDLLSQFNFNDTFPNWKSTQVGKDYLTQNK